MFNNNFTYSVVSPFGSDSTVISLFVISNKVVSDELDEDKAHVELDGFITVPGQSR